MFYYPLLQDGVHYYKTSIANLGKLVQWCRDKDEMCEKIAAAGRKRMRVFGTEGCGVGVL